MYLKKIELQGFKSFADKTVFEFMPGITAVVGPNGSGKSNISDAVRWVLGEQSMKSLRGSKLEDVIFAGTQARKSLGFAEVSLTINNEDGSLPTEYSEVVVTRRAYRSGESQFYINKNQCRLKDILELFMDTGIGRDGYSIIGQGKIDEILSNKSEERRHIFEEAAGIVKYRARKEESEKKLENTTQNLIRINDIISEIEGNLEPLKNQSEKAKKYLELREELKSIEVGLFLDNINKSKEKLEKTLQDEKILVSQEEEENQKLSIYHEEKENLKQEVESLIVKIENMQNQMFDSQNSIERLKSDITIANNTILNNTNNFDRLNQEIEEFIKKQEELEEEKKQKDEKKLRLFDSREKFEKELAEKEEELRKASMSFTSEEEKIEVIKQKVESNQDERLEKLSSINSAKATVEASLKREKQIEDEKYNTISELDSIRLNKDEISQNFYEIDVKRSKILEKLNNAISIKKENSQKVEEFVSEINKLENELRLKQTKHKFLVDTEKEKEGYQRSVKSILKIREDGSLVANGVCGTVASLIKTEEKYETAIEMCLGASLQNIVIETEEDGKKLVNYLRENNLGRASFLPISAVKGKKLDKIKGNSGIIAVASDIVKFDKKYEQIMLSLLGRTVVVENMDLAIKVAKQNSYSFRIVTLLGDVINPSGQMTGGSCAVRSNSILGRTRQIDELSKQIEDLKGDISKKTDEFEKYKESVDAILQEASDLEKQMQEIEIVYATEKQKLANIEENIEKLENKKEYLIKEHQEIQAHKEELEESIKQYNLDIALLDENISNMQKEVAEFALKNKDRQIYIDNLNLDITNLKISVSSFDESQNSIDEMVNRIEQDIANNNKSIEKRKNQIKQSQEENEQLQQHIENINLKIAEIENSVLNGNDEIKDLKQNRESKNKTLNELEEKIICQFKTIEIVKEGIAKIDLKKSKLEADIEQIINKMWEEYEITPNNAQGYVKPTNTQETTKKVNSIRNSIKALGSINIDSIEEYKQTKERYDFMSAQKIDLETAQQKLKKIISDMISIMKIQFTNQFKIINDNFKKTFVELFGGGKAELKIVDEENVLESGIEIEVQPPGKKLQNMMLLSGGEKAFTAIALLFAILELSPSPFCILDEIEAALDDVNVYRYADHLKKYIDKTQFLLITHRKGTMEAANTVYGVTMEENGVSKLLSLKLV